MRTYTLHKRTFAAAKEPHGPARDALNTDPITSQYFPSQKWAIRAPALMSDGTQNPSQRFHCHTFNTKAEAETAIEVWAKARCH